MHASREAVSVIALVKHVQKFGPALNLMFILIGFPWQFCSYTD